MPDTEGSRVARLEQRMDDAQAVLRLSGNLVRDVAVLAAEQGHTHEALALIRSDVAGVKVELRDVARSVDERFDRAEERATERDVARAAKEAEDRAAMRRALLVFLGVVITAMLGALPVLVTAL